MSLLIFINLDIFCRTSLPILFVIINCYSPTKNATCITDCIEASYLRRTKLWISSLSLLTTELAPRLSTLVTVSPLSTTSSSSSSPISSWSTTSCLLGSSVILDTAFVCR